MEKIEYLHLIKQSKNISSEMGWYFRELKYHIPKKVCDIDIISNDWIDFTCSHFDLAQHKIEQPREHYDKEANWLATCNQIMGRNSGNTQELNFGLNSNTNDLLCDMLGNDNIKKMGLQREGLLLRLIVNTTGHGIAWHEDGASSYRKKFPHLVGDIKRLWFPVIDWEDGHVFQIGSEVLSKWKSGNVWHIPWGVPHGSSNFGYTIKYTVSVTGVLNG